MHMHYASAMAPKRGRKQWRLSPESKLGFTTCDFLEDVILVFDIFKPANYNKLSMSRSNSFEYHETTNA